MFLRVKGTGLFIDLILKYIRLWRLNSTELTDIQLKHQAQNILCKSILKLGLQLEKNITILVVLIN